MVESEPIQSRRAVIAAWCAASLLVLLPLVKAQSFVYPHYAGGALFQLAVLFLLMVWAAPRRRAAASGRIAAAEWLLIAYALSVVISVAFAPNKRLSIIASVWVLMSVIWALLLGRLLSRTGASRFLCRAIFVAGTLGAVAALYYFVRPFSLLRLNDAMHNGTAWGYLTGGAFNPDAVEWVLGHRNFLAGFVLPAAVLAVADLARNIFRARQGPLGFRWFVTAPAAILTVGTICLCGSIGGLLGFAAGVGVLVLLLFKPPWRVVCVAAACIVVIGAVIALSRPAVEARIAGTEKFQRWFLWKGAVRMIGERPLLGWGPGMFPLHFADFKPTEPMRHGLLTSITYHPHNEWLMVAAEGGLAGLGLYVAALTALVWAAVRCVGRMEDGAARLGLWSVVGVFVAMVVHGMLNIDLRYWAPCALYWTIIGMLLAATRPPVAPGAQSATASPALQAASFAGSVAVAVAGILLYVVPGIRAEWLLHDGIAGASSSAERARMSERAEGLSRYVQDYLMALEMGGLGLAKDNDVEGAIKVFERMNRNAPGYGHVRTVLSDLYFRRLRARGLLREVGDDPDLQRALSLLRDSIRQNPWNDDTRIMLARALMTESTKNISEALEQAKAAVDMGPEHAEPYLVYAGLLMDAQRAEEALKMAEKAAMRLTPEEKGLSEKIRWIQEQARKHLGNAAKPEATAP